MVGLVIFRMGYLYRQQSLAPSIALQRRLSCMFLFVCQVDSQMFFFEVFPDTFTSDSSQLNYQEREEKEIAKKDISFQTPTGVEESFLDEIWRIFCIS